jgi:thymidylate kinase
MGDLIFVEGVPGTGKSTTAQFIAHQLTRHGRPAQWFYEEQTPNPFVPEIDPAEYRDWDHFIDLRVDRWRECARAFAESTESLVAESVLLQAPVFTMLRRDVEAGLIEGLLNRLADVIAPLRPTLIYLAHADPERAWRAIAARRGGDFAVKAVKRSEEWPYTRSRSLAGLDGVLAYWRAHGALCDRIASWLPMHTLRLDVSAGTWSTYRQQICAFLQIPSEAPVSVASNDLARAVGSYRAGDRRLTVSLEDDRLVLRGLLWASNTLLPRQQDVFDVEAWPFRIRFERGANGLVRALHWEGPRLWWGGLDSVYDREPTNGA